jgi:hypothetical protein
VKVAGADIRKVAHARRTVSRRVERTGIARGPVTGTDLDAARITGIARARVRLACVSGGRIACVVCRAVAGLARFIPAFRQGARIVACRTFRWGLRIGLAAGFREAKIVDTRDQFASSRRGNQGTRDPFVSIEVQALVSIRQVWLRNVVGAELPLQLKRAGRGYRRRNVTACMTQSAQFIISASAE